VYERLRFDRVRKCQVNGEDPRWHSALQDLDAGTELNPADLKHRVSIRVSMELLLLDLFADLHTTESLVVVI
jgi:hypothetical protein